ncbi:MAG TPA: fumarylacetoacetate hydrolase family protein [Solirubrobacteraceae bacterium]|nr:fumarylacetoacetate hydrolase family protein [Solirubrobacteraceae bacterium]
MKFANVEGRLALVEAAGEDTFTGADVAHASGDLLPADPAAALWRWSEVLDWASAYDGPLDLTIHAEQLGAPSPAPAQIFAIGVNYADHLAEAGWDQPEVPMVFPKLLPALAGPCCDVALSEANDDWEVELVVVIGKPARDVATEDAWDYVAGLTVGQDYSARTIQMRPKELPQFSLGKSLPGFAPIGPVIATPDGVTDRDDLELTCSVNGEEMQHSRTGHLVFGVAALVEYLSAATTLLPGDLIFTGTPSGIGATRTPPHFLSAGDIVESYIEGIGSMRHRFVPKSEGSMPRPIIPTLARQA